MMAPGFAMTHFDNTQVAGTHECVLLADRNLRLSEGLCGLLETAFTEVFLVSDRASLMEGAQRLAPALVVVDVGFAQGDLAELLLAIRDRAPATKLLVLSVHDEPTVARAVLVAGADGLVLKRSIATELLPAIDALRAGQRYVSPAVRH
jgi:DNA-binding NarL/FixJ family response regulator